MADGPTKETRHVSSGDIYARPGFLTVRKLPRRRASAPRRVVFIALLAAAIIALLAIAVGENTIR